MVLRLPDEESRHWIYMRFGRVIRCLSLHVCAHKGERERIYSSRWRSRRKNGVDSLELTRDTHGSGALTAQSFEGSIWPALVTCERTRF
jgi:hypothetical protein